MYPRKIALLTDSCADIAPELAAENHIYVVPLRILCSDGEYRDGVNIFNTDIYRYLHAGELPKTSLPSAEDFGKVVEQIAADGYDGIIAVMMSSGLSGTYNLARLIAEECEGKIAVKAYDSLNASLGQGMILPGYLLLSCGITAVVVFFGILIFNKVEKTFMDTV